MVYFGGMVKTHGGINTDFIINKYIHTYNIMKAKDKRRLEHHVELYLLTQKLSVIPVSDISSTTLSSAQLTYSGKG